VDRITWIVSANASLARIFEHQRGRDKLQLLSELLHPESREKGVDLVTDRPGRTRGYGDSHWAFPDTDPRREEHEQFATEIAEHLERALLAGRFERLILSAAPAFLGLLKPRLNGQVQARVAHALDKDYTASNERELFQHLEDYIAF
jgi:protein required for attachment to host cells